MINLKNALNFLCERPSIGMAGGFGSGFLLSIQSILSDENTLKMIAGLGAIFGTVVAGITVVLKGMELSEKLITKFKRKP